MTLGTTPTANVRAGQEVLRLYASTPLRHLSISWSGHEQDLRGQLTPPKTKGPIPPVTGDLILEDKENTVLLIRTMNDAFDGQFINEANITGRVCKDARGRREKLLQRQRCRQSIRQGRRTSKEFTDYFQVRGYGKLKDRFDKLSKRAWSSCPAWSLTSKNKEGNEYIELKTRFLQVHKKIRRWRWWSKPRTQIQCRGNG